MSKVSESEKNAENLQLEGDGGARGQFGGQATVGERATGSDFDLGKPVWGSDEMPRVNQTRALLHSLLGAGVGEAVFQREWLVALAGAGKGGRGENGEREEGGREHGEKSDW